MTITHDTCPDETSGTRQYPQASELLFGWPLSAYGESEDEAYDGDERSPVFVDETGRRSRFLRRAGNSLALLCCGYVAVVGTSVAGGTLAPSSVRSDLPFISQLEPKPSLPPVKPQPRRVTKPTVPKVSVPVKAPKPKPVPPKPEPEPKPVPPKPEPKPPVEPRPTTPPEPKPPVEPKPNPEESKPPAPPGTTQPGTQPAPSGPGTKAG
jgi:hypothetical protein